MEVAVDEATTIFSTSPQQQDRDDWIFKSRLANAIERYDESSQWLKNVVLLNTDLSIQERNLLRTAYKGAYDNRRNSWLILANLEQAQTTGGKKGRKSDIKRIRHYRIHFQKEMDKIAAEVFYLMDHHLLPNASSADARVFFYMMKGDYHRYCAELVVGEARREHAINSMVCYKAAHRMSEMDLHATHPIRLGVSINYAVLFWRLFLTVERAVRMAKNGYDECIAVLHIADAEHVEDSIRLMGVLRNIMTKWSRKLPKGMKNIMANRDVESASTLT